MTIEKDYEIIGNEKQLDDFYGALARAFTTRNLTGEGKPIDMNEIAEWSLGTGYQFIREPKGELILLRSKKDLVKLIAEDEQTMERLKQKIETETPVKLKVTKAA